MGQVITVTRKPGTDPGVVRFELNRSLTGMGIERYDTSPAGIRPPDALARRLFELGATHVTIYSNVVTVQAPADRWKSIGADIEDALTNLFIYYRDGVAPAPATPAAVEGAVSGSDAEPAPA